MTSTFFLFVRRHATLTIIFAIMLVVVIGYISFHCLLPQRDSASTYLLESGFSNSTVRQLKKWDALPTWMPPVVKAQEGWLSGFHQNLTRPEWPDCIKEISVNTRFQPGFRLGESTYGGASEIYISPFIPTYLETLLSIIDGSLADFSPDDSTPISQANPAKVAAATRELESLIGVIETTGYLQTKEFQWRPAIQFATRFIYYHELGHKLACDNDSLIPEPDLYPEESAYAEEIATDQIALALLELEIRNNQDLSIAAHSGAALAMALMSLKEFSQSYKKDKRSIKAAIHRVRRLEYWIKKSVNLKETHPQALEQFRFFWQLFHNLLKHVRDIPSPLFSLVYKAADRPKTDWAVVRNEIVKSCLFGNHEAVIKNLRDIRMAAIEQADKFPRAKRAVQLLNYIKDETEVLEPGDRGCIFHWDH